MLDHAPPLTKIYLHTNLESTTMSRPRADTRLSGLPDEVELSDDDAPREAFNFPDEVSRQNNSTSPRTTIQQRSANNPQINDTLAYINEIVVERQQTYKLLKAELKVANTKKLYEMCLKQQNVSLASPPSLPTTFLLVTSE